MSIPRFLPALAVTATLALLAGCSSSPMSRIDANRPLYESWPLEIQQAVLDNKVIKDMTPEMVEMAVGRPKEISSRSTAKGMEEVWIYRKGGGGGMSAPAISVGGMIGGVGVSGPTMGGGGGYEAPEEHEVVFVDGRVVRSTFDG